MFDFNLIHEYQLEITTYCNAACPQCPRNIQGGRVNPYLPLVHLDRTVIDAAFTVDHCQNLKQIFFCGSYGDPIMHPEFLDILQDFRNKNPTNFFSYNLLHFFLNLPETIGVNFYRNPIKLKQSATFKTSFFQK